MDAMNRGMIIASLITSLIFLAATVLTNTINLCLAALTGIIATVLIGFVTEHYTSHHRSPVQKVAQAATTGAGTNVIAGLAVGMESTGIPVLIICTAIAISHALGGFYGIALAAVGMLSLTGIVLAIDSYGPITDNAGGIAEMAGMPEKVRKITDALDAAGNTTKATTKGVAIASAALSALALFVAFVESVGLKSLDILNPGVTIGLFIGGALPFIFSSFLMGAVGRAAIKMVDEVCRQSPAIKG